LISPESGKVSMVKQTCDANNDPVGR